MSDESPQPNIIDTDLTLKQRKWLDVYLDTGNASEAARQAGYADAEVSGSENKRKLAIPLAQRMQAMGLDDASLLQKLIDGLEATSVKIASDKGTICDERFYPDYAVRHKYLDMALRLKGLLNNKIEISGSPDTESAAIKYSIVAPPPESSSTPSSE